MLEFSFTMTRLVLTLSIVLALAAGLAPIGSVAAAHDCCCVAACACPEESEEPACDECGPSTPADEAPIAPSVARVLAPAPSAPVAATAVVTESPAVGCVASAPRASGRLLLAQLSTLRV